MSQALNNPYTDLLVDLGAIADNLAALRALMPPGDRVAAVVKADAYGHGLLPVARCLLAAGAETLAVATWPEGQALREAGIDASVLVLLGHEPFEAEQVVGLGLTPVLAREECFAALAAQARAQGKTVSCQLKVDTGMGRLGVEPGAAIELLERVAALGGLEVSGVVSHLATGGDPGCEHARGQAEVFGRLLGELRAKGYSLHDSSLCGSGGVLAPPWAGEPQSSLHRLGISLYGGLPHAASAGAAELRTAMRYSSRLIEVRTIGQGNSVSYGQTWVAGRETLLGVAPVGYSDGYPRAASNRGAVLVGAQLAPIRGRVCMNLTMVDLTDLAVRPRVGDEVVLLGGQGDASIELDQLAAWGHTIGYDVACSLGAANRRRYIGQP